MMGLVGGHDVTARFVGDASLSSRPMERVLKPLREMGVVADTAPGGRLPALITGGRLKAIRYAPPEASAQVKSAIMLAGLRADGVTVVEEKEATRDHTERMLRAFGVEVGVEERARGGPVVSVRGGQALRAIKGASVAGDPSSAAFAIAMALIAGEGEARATGHARQPDAHGLPRCGEGDGRGPARRSRWTGDGRRHGARDRVGLAPQGHRRSIRRWCPR